MQRFPLLRKKNENVYFPILVILSKTAVINNNGPILVLREKQEKLIERGGGEGG